jgi:hypothetical protein
MKDLAARLLSEEPESVAEEPSPLSVSVELVRSVGTFTGFDPTLKELENHLADELLRFLEHRGLTGHWALCAYVSHTKGEGEGS